MKVKVNILHTPYGPLVTICDPELIGRRLEQDRIVFEISSFYDGREIDDKDIDESLLKEAHCIHAVGKKSIEVVKRAGLVKEGDVKVFQEVPIVIIFNVQKILC